MTIDTAATPDRVRPAGHGLDLDALRPWLARHLPGFGDVAGALSASRVIGGQSNPTWILRAGEGGPARAWVLRAKPGPAAGLLPSAHAIEREFTVMRALADTDVPVPKVHALCEDESVLGAAFYVMDFVEGRIFREAALPGVSTSERGAIHDEANRVIAALHRADWRALGLGDFGRADAYFERMIGRWSRQYRASTASVTQPIDAMERLIDWLPQHIPAAAREADATLVHGDFRIENLIFHPREPRVLAVLDWELSTLGNPLSDFAYHCMAWHHRPGVLQGFGGLDLAALGLPSERAYIERYCERSGRSSPQAQAEVLRDWNFYLACNLFRLSAILQGIARRAEDGTAANPSAVAIGAMATPVAELGWSLAQVAAPG
jgi:aminoglycoside phosphotransferase (APT) family kinase protein